MDENLFRFIRQATSRRHWFGLAAALLLYYLWQIVEQSIVEQRLLPQQHAETLEHGLVAVIATLVTVVNLRQRDRQLIEQEQLRLKHRQAEQAVLQLEAARATAIATMHHLSQPLTVIMGYVQLLLTTPPSERNDADLHMILQATKQATLHLRQLRLIAHYTTTPYPTGEPMLDLTAQGTHNNDLKQ